jgi:hypothetical protein
MSQSNVTPRLSFVDPDHTSKEIAQALTLLPVINVFRAMANATTLYPTFGAYVLLLFQPMELNAAGWR